MLNINRRRVCKQFNGKKDKIFFDKTFFVEFKKSFYLTPLN